MSDSKLLQARIDLSEAWHRENTLTKALLTLDRDLDEALTLISEMRAQWMRSWAAEKCMAILAKHGIEHPPLPGPLPEPKRDECRAQQLSDQMNCDRCLLSWDVNDPHPPKCGKKS